MDVKKRTPKETGDLRRNKYKCFPVFFCPVIVKDPFPEFVTDYL